MARKSIRVLVVDDEDSIREACARILERDGYLVSTASNGLDGLELSSKVAFDLALVDIKMPVLDGMKLMEILHKDNPELTLMVMTGHGTKKTATEAMEAGARYFLPKPFTPNDLRKAVAAVTGGGKDQTCPEDIS